MKCCEYGPSLFIIGKKAFEKRVFGQKTYNSYFLSVVVNLSNQTKAQTLKNIFVKI